MEEEARFGITFGAWLEEEWVPRERRVSPSLGWKIDEIPGEIGWARQASRETFERLALCMVERGVPERTVAALLDEAYWAVADMYGG